MECLGGGRALVGVDAANNNFNTVEKTGGEETHILTQQESASYKIGFMQTVIPRYHCEWSNGGVVCSDIKGKNNRQFWMDGISMSREANDNTIAYGWDIYTNGGGQAHNNLQPYITCYFWKRTA